MKCHCPCHASGLDTTNPMSSAFCFACDSVHPATFPSQQPKVTPQQPMVKATSYTVRALIAETAAHHVEPYMMIRYRFRVKLTPYNHVEVDVAVSSQLAQSNWMDAEEEAHRYLARHLNDYWTKNPQSDWAAQALLEANKNPKPQVGGHALTVGALWYEQQHHVYQAVSGDVVTGDLTKWLPGLNEAVVCPAKIPATCGDCWGKPFICTHSAEDRACPAQNVVQRMIVHLNDDHRWKRDQIADWLETLDVDLTFGAEPPPKPVLPKADRGKVLYIIANTAAQARQEARRRRRGPQDYRYVSTQDGHAGQIRGTHKAQFCVAQGTVVIPPIQHYLEAAQAVQVGEESSPPGPGIYVESVPAYYDEIGKYVSSVEYELVDALKQDLAKLKEHDQQQKKFGTKKLALDQGSEGSSVGYAMSDLYWKTALATPIDVVTVDYVKKLYEQSQHVDPWPGGPVHHEPKPNPKQKALDAKKNPSHTAFTVNPTKKSPFKK